MSFSNRLLAEKKIIHQEGIVGGGCLSDVG